MSIKRLFTAMAAGLVILLAAAVPVAPAQADFMADGDFTVSYTPVVEVDDTEFRFAGAGCLGDESHVLATVNKLNDPILIINISRKPDLSQGGSWQMDFNPSEHSPKPLELWQVNVSCIRYDAPSNHITFYMQFADNVTLFATPTTLPSPTATPPLAATTSAAPATSRSPLAKTGANAGIVAVIGLGLAGVGALLAWRSRHRRNG